jgi:ketosteroid isomerase-like protein
MSENVVTVEAMKELERRWVAADSAAGRASLYAEDAIFDNVNEQPLMGKDAIQAHYGTVKANTMSYDDREAVVMGSWGYTSGIWTSGSYQGHFLHVMKLVDGKLKMIRHIHDVCDGECPE